MAAAMPNNAGAPSAAGKGATVSLLGRKFSWDSILIAAAGLVGVFFLFRAGQPVSAGVSPLGASAGTVDSGGAGVSIQPPSGLGSAPPDPTKPPSTWAPERYSIALPGTALYKYRIAHHYRTTIPLGPARSPFPNPGGIVGPAVSGGWAGSPSPLSFHPVGPIPPVIGPR